MSFDCVVSDILGLKQKHVFTSFKPEISETMQSNKIKLVSLESCLETQTKIFLTKLVIGE